MKNELKYKVGDRVVIEESNIDRYGFIYAGMEGVILKVHACGYGYDYLVGTVKNPGGVWCNVKCIVSEKPDTEKIVITHDGKTTTATMYCGDGTKKVATARCAPEDKFDFRIGAEIAMGRLVDKLAYSNHNVIRVVFREGGKSYAYVTRHTAKVGMEIVVPIGQHGKETRATVVEVIPGAEYNGEFAISAMKEIDVVEVSKYNGKVVCIENSSGNRLSYTVGKIYQFKNGQIEDDHGILIPCDPRCNPIYNFEDWRKFSASTWVEIVE